MEKMQEFIDFIFYEVWCKAPTEEYGIHLFEPSDLLHKVMKELNGRDLAGQLKTGSGKWFYEAVNNIFNEFRELDAKEVGEYRQFYQANNQIGELCSNNHEVSPVRYDDLNKTKIELNRKIEGFFKKLYSSGFFGLSFVVDALGSYLGAYYIDFIRANSAGCCPFCGLLPIDNQFDPTRDAFDHYLPKSKYPFNSVNLKNLAPSCNKCNSGNKRDKDPLCRNNGDRRKAFYPFSTDGFDPHVTIHVRSEDWTKPQPADLEITISSVSHPEEVETWNDLFLIKDRYSAKCCDNGGGLYWRKRVLEESENYGLSTQAMLDAEIKSSRANPWAESNFLKLAFLEGCQRAGLFDVIAMEGAAP
jgi:5-methylcytosine-specific restriction endonuclease McrA